MSSPCSEKIRFYLRLEALNAASGLVPGARWQAAHQRQSTHFSIFRTLPPIGPENELLKALLQQRRDIEALPANATVDGQPAKRYWPLYLKPLIPSRQRWAAPAKSCVTTSGCSSFETASACPAAPVNLTIPQLHYWLSQPAEIRRQELLSLARPFCRLPTRLSSFSAICGRRPSFLMPWPSTGQCRFPRQAVPINSHASGCLRKVNAFLT